MHDRHDAFVPECSNRLTKAQNSLHIRVQTAYNPQSIKGVRVCLRERVNAFSVYVCECGLMLGSGSSWNPCLKPQNVMFIEGFIDKLNRLNSEWNVGDKGDIRMQMLCVALHMFSMSHSGFCCLFKARYDHGRFEVWIYPFLWGTFATGVCFLGRWIFLKFYFQAA